MFYTFRQNNSRGQWIGPVLVCVECDSLNEANEIAVWHGVYFDGCAEGRDCECCGDRWSQAYDNESLTELPTYCGEFVCDQERPYKIVYKDMRVLTGGIR